MHLNVLIYFQVRINEIYRGPFLNGSLDVTTTTSSTYLIFFNGRLGINSSRKDAKLINLKMKKHLVCRWQCCVTVKGQSLFVCKNSLCQMYREEIWQISSL